MVTAMMLYGTGKKRHNPVCDENESLRDDSRHVIGLTVDTT
jgi:hypothetical protein